MDTNENLDHITTTECDCCHARRPVLLHHHNGTPVLTMCKVCDHHSHENTARRDIDAWLAGGDTFAFGR